MSDQAELVTALDELNEAQRALRALLNLATSTNNQVVAADLDLLLEPVWTRLDTATERLSFFLGVDQVQVIAVEVSHV